MPSTSVHLGMAMREVENGIELLLSSHGLCDKETFEGGGWHSKAYLSVKTQGCVE